MGIPVVRRKRVGTLEGGYETSGPSYNNINPIVKRRGQVLEDPGFRSDAPS